MSNFYRSQGSSGIKSFHSNPTFYSNQSTKSISPSIYSQKSSQINKMANDFIRLNKINSPSQMSNNSSNKSMKTSSIKSPNLGKHEMQILR